MIKRFLNLFFEIPPRGVGYRLTNENLFGIISGLNLQSEDIILSICGSGDQPLAMIEKAKEELSEYLGPNLSKNVRVIKNEENIFIEAIKNADLLIGAVLVAGTKAPEVVKEHHIKLMKKGSVIVDVSIDQGGCIWGSRATSHSHPIYEIDGKIYCCVANMPGQVARQSTQALTNATLPYLLKMANQGIIQSLHQDYRFARGLNTYQGNITYESVAKDLQMEDKFIPQNS